VSIGCAQVNCGAAERLLSCVIALQWISGCAGVPKHWGIGPANCLSVAQMETLVTPALSVCMAKFVNASGAVRQGEQLVHCEAIGLNIALSKALTEANCDFCFWFHCKCAAAAADGLALVRGTPFRCVGRFSDLWRACRQRLQFDSCP
jgi:hypothetical protein